MLTDKRIQQRQMLEMLMIRQILLATKRILQETLLTAHMIRRIQQLQMLEMPTIKPILQEILLILLMEQQTMQFSQVVAQQQYLH